MSRGSKMTFCANCGIPIDEGAVCTPCLKEACETIEVGLYAKIDVVKCQSILADVLEDYTDNPPQLDDDFWQRLLGGQRWELN